LTGFRNTKTGCAPHSISFTTFPVAGSHAPKYAERIFKKMSSITRSPQWMLAGILEFWRLLFGHLQKRGENSTDGPSPAISPAPQFMADYFSPSDVRASQATAAFLLTQ
jgi:hypothetical protein